MQAKRTLHVHLIASLQQAEVRLVERLADDVEGKLVVGDLGNGEAHAIDRDALAVLHVSPCVGE